jgi:AcrR family transcriptional regulator
MEMSNMAAVKRAYNNESREKSSAQNKKLIIETFVQLLVEKKGADVTFREIAARTGLAERSIFRFYNDKDVLHEELDRYLMAYVQSSVEKLAEVNIAQFGKYAFSLFDKYESLILAYVYSPFGRQARSIFRQKLNQLLAAKLVQEKPVARTPEVQRRIALICSMINAKIWHDIREDYGFTGVEMGDTIEWAIRAMIKEL